MRFALLADVHGNLEALDAVLADVDRCAADARVVCAGDVVGYGPDPEDCLLRLLARGAALVRGSHEEMVLGWRDDTDCFGASIAAVAYTRAVLSRRACVQLAALPAVADVGDGVIVCHGDVDDAGGGVAGAAEARRAFARMRELYARARVLVCGHTHEAMCFSLDRSLQHAAPGTRHSVDGGCVVNPGAVGRARPTPAPPLASWALLDTEAGTVSFSAVPYAHEITLRKQARAGLLPALLVPVARGLGRAAATTFARATRAWIEVRDVVTGVERGVESSVTTPVLPHPAVSGLARARQVVHESRVGRALSERRAHSGDRPVGVGRDGDGTGAVILAYHGVTSNDDVAFVDPRFAVNVAVFRRQMELVAAQRTVLSLSTLVELLERRAPLPPRSVVLTFDDGYASTERVAAPILASLGLPAIVYLPTGQISREQSRSVDVLYGAFCLRTRHRVAAPALGVAPVLLTERALMSATYLRLADGLARLEGCARDAVLADIVAQLRPSHAPPRLTMGWGDVRRLRARYAGVEFGVNLRDPLDRTPGGEGDRAGFDVVRCVADLRSATGLSAQHFSFRCGRSCARAGVRSAVVTEGAARVRPGADVFRLPRALAPPDVRRLASLTDGR